MAEIRVEENGDLNVNHDAEVVKLKSLQRQIREVTHNLRDIEKEKIKMADHGETITNRIVMSDDVVTLSFSEDNENREVTIPGRVEVTVRKI